jgi:ligand-binding SRPBCC domain-containing protein
MKFYQKVKIKNTKFEDVINSFHDIKFIKFLTYLQPIKIINWDGIQNDKLAFFKLWFLGWKNFKVKHSNYKNNTDELSFTDRGIELPLGLKSWHHDHIIINNENEILIIDSLNIKHSNTLIGYIIFPFLILPIFIRFFLYKIYFRKYTT